MTARIIGKPAELRLTCPRCESIIAYEPRDLRDHDVSRFGFVVESYRVLDCPKCKAVIRPVRKVSSS